MLRRSVAAPEPDVNPETLPDRTRTPRWEGPDEDVQAGTSQKVGNVQRYPEKARRSGDGTALENAGQRGRDLGRQVGVGGVRPGRHQVARQVVLAHGLARVAAVAALDLTQAADQGDRAA